MAESPDLVVILLDSAEGITSFPVIYIHINDFLP